MWCADSWSYMFALRFSMQDGTHLVFALHVHVLAVNVDTVGTTWNSRSAKFPQMSGLRTCSVHAPRDRARRYQPVAGARRALEQKPLPGSSLRVLGARAEPTTDRLGCKYGVMAWCASLWMDGCRRGDSQIQLLPASCVAAYVSIYIKNKSCPSEGSLCRPAGRLLHERGDRHPQTSHIHCSAFRGCMVRLTA